MPPTQQIKGPVGDTEWLSANDRHHWPALAKRSGVSRATLYNWSNGNSAMVVERLCAVCDVLRVPASVLMRRAEGRARRSP